MLVILLIYPDKPAQGDTDYFEPTPTHRELNELGTTLVKKKDDAGRYMELYQGDYVDKLKQGGIDEDQQYFTIPTECDDGRFMRHFYHPYTPKGLQNGLLPPIGSTRCPDAVTWARSSAGDSETTKGDRTWTGAIENYDYTSAAKEDAYWRLGHVAHLVGDMAQPEHTHLEPHPPIDGLDPEARYERWVAENWDGFRQALQLAIDTDTLSPASYQVMEEYLTELAKISYNLSSFNGGELFQDNLNPIDKSTSFAKMFNVQYVNAVRPEWFLFNYSNNALLGTYDGTYSTYQSDIQFWETIQETGYGPANHYYVEDIISAIPSEFQGTPNTNLQHLGELYASNLLPLAVEHIAGLYQHYYDIVNHPPYVHQVTVTQAGRCLYKAHWQDGKPTETNPPRIVNRELVADCNTSGLISKNSGNVEIKVEFGPTVGEPEKVQEVAVSLTDGRGGSCEVTGDVDPSQTFWTGTIDPSSANDCAIDGALTIAITAKDINNHYQVRNFAGDELDSYPQLPAKVNDAVNYNWSGYVPGIDRNHRIQSNEGVDTVLIIDASGSMDTNDPLDRRIDAAKGYVDAAQNEDRLAVVAFSSGARVLADFRIIQSAEDRKLLKAAIDRVGSAGGTDINDALDTGFLLLGGTVDIGPSQSFGGGTANRKVAVLLTDGEHTDGEYNPQSHLQFQDKGWPLYTVSLGGGSAVAAQQVTAANREAESQSTITGDFVEFLISIAAATGGLHFSADNADELIGTYRRISSRATGAEKIQETSLTLSQGEQQAVPVELDGNRPSATFFSNWIDGDVNLSLTTPKGQVIDASTTDPAIYHAKERTYEIYTIASPESGQWQASLTAVEAPEDQTNVNLNVSALPSKAPGAIFLPLIMGGGNVTGPGTIEVATVTPEGKREGFIPLTPDLQGATDAWVTMDPDAIAVGFWIENGQLWADVPVTTPSGTYPAELMIAIGNVNDNNHLTRNIQIRVP